MGRQPVQRKHETPFYNVCDCTIIRGKKSEEGKFSVAVIAKKGGITIKSIEATDKEDSFHKAFQLEMEVIEQHKASTVSCVVNPNALRAYDKHQTWLDREQATQR